MRELTSHRVNGCNEALTITVKDEPGAGGAAHRYDITGFCADNNPSMAGVDDEYSIDAVCVVFQNGPPADGVNGITNEALLAVLEDRLVGFQSGPFAHPLNADALDHVRAAMSCLQQRTRERVARGVEGTHQV